MEGFIDIHTHILPLIDDGARDMAEAMQLLHMAWDDGTREVVLTPHYRASYRKISTSQIHESFEELCCLVQQELPEMKLHLGRELHHEQELPDRLREGLAEPFLGTRYVLLEFGSGSRRDQIVRGVENMLYKGYTPIIAHVERYNVCRNDTKLLDELLDMGALIQMNAGSIMGEHGWGVRHYCHKLLRARKVHFIASDAHRIDWRPPVLQKCRNRVAKKYGEDYAMLLFRNNAQKMLENKEI